MGLIKNLLIIVLLVIALAHFAPGTYESVKDWTWEKIRGSTDNLINSSDISSHTPSLTDFAMNNSNSTFSGGNEIG